MDSIKEEIAMSTPQLSAWMLMIVQRTFSLLYSPDSECFAKNGFHIQCAICLRSKCIELRAAAIATLSCFMRPFESNVNSQLLLMAIIGNISDVSFLVRFCLLLLVKKFVLSFDQLDLYEFNFNEKSYKEINKKLFGSEELKNNFEVIDNIMENMNFTDVTCEVSFYLLHFFSKDPHCSIRKVSNEMIKFLNIEKSSNEEYFEFSEEQEINEFLDNLNQNEALYRIMLYNTIENLKIKESETKHHYLLVENSFKIKNKINFIRFDNKNNGIAFSDNKTIYYLLQNEIYKHEFQTRIQNIQIISIDDRNYVTVLASDGCVYVWDPLINTFYITFRFNPKPNENKLNFICSTDSTGFYTISNNDVIAQWNLKSEQLLNEYELNIESEILYVEKTNDKIYMSLTNGDIFVFCIINKKYEIINHNLPIHKMIHINNFLYCLNSENQIELFYIGKWENILDNVFSFDVINNDKLLVCQINKAPFICNKSGNVLYEFTGVPSNCICACGEKGNFAAFGCDDGTLKITEIKK